MGSGFSGGIASPGRIEHSGVATGRTVNQAYAGRYRGYGRYNYGRNGYGAPGTGMGFGLAAWDYRTHAPTGAAGTCHCNGHFTSGTAGAW